MPREHQWVRLCEEDVEHRPIVWEQCCICGVVRRGLVGDSYDSPRARVEYLRNAKRLGTNAPGCVPSPPRPGYVTVQVSEEALAALRLASQSVNSEKAMQGLNLLARDLADVLKEEA